MFRSLRAIQDVFFGRAIARQNYRAALARDRSFSQTLDRLKRFWPELCQQAEAASAPIFIQAVGWRSGSTLLQRMICHEGTALIWGEPYANAGLIETMSRQFLPFDRDWPRREWFFEGDMHDLSSHWIANLYPGAEMLKKAHRSFFEELFAKPAMAAGALRWGIKNVRLGTNEAHYRRWLFPDAQFIFLIRNPWNCYSSYRAIGSRSYHQWPDRPVFTPLAFGRMWRELSNDLHQEAHLLNGIVVKYEELQDPEAVARISHYLGLKLLPSTNLPKLGSGNATRLSRLESLMLERGLSGAASSFGYSDPGAR